MSNARKGNGKVRRGVRLPSSPSSGGSRPNPYTPTPPDRKDTLTHKEVIKLGVSTQPALTPEAEKAIIADKVAGSTNAAIALRYQVSEHTVSRVYRQFISAANRARKLSDEPPEIFHKKIRAKAVTAIESGLVCNKDPYRRAGVGIKVMQGIGEFKGDNASVINNNFALVQATPAQFRQRYLGLPEQEENNESANESNESTTGSPTDAITGPDRDHPRDTLKRYG